jgi:catechol 2,3-dioxygenase-like lactoylglutathione lyase family enzyme
MERRADPAPDTGALLHFEHVNLRVPDHRAATLFFVEGLGLTRDPYRMVGVRNMWVNVGLQQFHLPIGGPTPLPGEIGLVVPDLDDVERQLGHVGRELKDSEFACTRVADALEVRTPWGHSIRVLPGGGHAEGIGAFYRDLLQCPVEMRAINGDVTAWVTVGPHQTFRFRERPGGGTVSNTNHVAVYLTRYRTIYAALCRRGLIMEEDRDEQFRFCRIVDPRSDATLFVFEHEMRSLHHPDFLRPLVNRVPVPYRVD